MCAEGRPTASQHFFFSTVEEVSPSPLVLADLKFHCLLTTDERDEEIWEDLPV